MYPKAFVDYLVHFHGDRDYFECHEILEDYWKSINKGNKNSIWVAFIQTAVSSYHHRRGNFPGANKALKNALSIFHHQQEALNGMGLDSDALISLLEKRWSAIAKNEIYTSFNLPIADHALLNECKKECNRLGMVWGSSSDLTNKSLVHRHIYRDRTSVIMARDLARKQKKATNKD